MVENGSLPKTFDELVSVSDKPVLVDFWAEWCQPCRAMSPVVERIALDLSGKILTVKVNVDKKPEVSARYDISSIPTVMLFYKGQILMRLSGARGYDELRTEVEKSLPK